MEYFTTVVRLYIINGMSDIQINGNIILPYIEPIVDCTWQMGIYNGDTMVYIYIIYTYYWGYNGNWLSGNNRNGGIRIYVYIKIYNILRIEWDM